MYSPTCFFSDIAVKISAILPEKNCGGDIPQQDMEPYCCSKEIKEMKEVERRLVNLRTCISTDSIKLGSVYLSAHTGPPFWYQWYP